MNEMIERIKRALHEAAGTGVSYDELSPASQDFIGVMAHAMLGAMREPTEGMYLARPIVIPDREDWRRIWGWAIDAASKD